METRDSFPCSVSMDTKSMGTELAVALSMLWYLAENWKGETIWEMLL